MTFSMYDIYVKYFKNEIVYSVKGNVPKKYL